MGERPSTASHRWPRRRGPSGRHAERLVICGLPSEYCVDTTTRRAFSLGYDITLVADGHSTCAGSLTAAQKIAHHNEVLGGWFARVVPASQVWA
ncbi:MAG: isochorismatase family protein [Candidatus Latescibacterota bacterium]